MAFNVTCHAQNRPNIREINEIFILRCENFQCHNSRTELQITIRKQGRVKLMTVKSGLTRDKRAETKLSSKKSRKEY